MKKILAKISDWLKPDKSLHIMLSTALVVLFFGITKSLVIATLVTVGIGLIKEYVFDGLLKMGAKNVQDIYADLIGTLIGVVYVGYLLLI